ncbi:MAG: hypothetical protein ACT4OZ_11285 [Gemmatimonadota bacterium]
MFSWLLAAAFGALATYLAYPRANLRGTLSRVAAAARFVAVMALILLVFNSTVGRRRVMSPLVALDVSASWMRGRDSSAFVAARSAAHDASSDSVIAFGDSVRRSGDDIGPADNSSSVRAVAERAIAMGRPLVVFTDGELDDAAALEGIPIGSRVVLGDTTALPDAAVADIRAPRLTAPGDTVEARVDVVASTGGSAPGRVSLTLNGREVTGARLDSLPPGGERSLTMRFVAPAVSQQLGGNAELRATVLSDGDRYPVNNSAATVLDIASSAAAVLVSTSPDLDSRELAAALRGTVSLPTRAYFRVAPGLWREDGTLGAVSEETVRRAVRESPLVVLHGDTALFGPPRSVARGALALIAPPPSDVGEWFATGAPVSPVATHLAGTVWDSLAPLEVSPITPTNAEFEILETRRGRRLDRRAAVFGWERPRRVVVAGASGFWRWRFRGGVGADAYAAVWGSVLDWLSGEHSDVRRAVPATGSVRAGSAVQWRRGSEADSVVDVTLTRRGTGVQSAESTSVILRFGSNATTETRALDEGTWEARTAGGTSLLVVNPSLESVPRRRTVRGGDYGTATAAGAAPRARDWPWLFGLAIAALCAEWIVRRRAGLR